MSLHDRHLQQAAWTRDLRQYLFERLDWRSTHRLLEVGCGTGAIFGDLEAPAGLSPNSPALFGVDLSWEALRECRLHSRHAQLIQADALALPFPDQTFDLTYCHFLLLWVDDPLAALREMRRVTSGHVLALAEPDYSNRVDAPSQLIELGRLQTEALRQQGAEVSIGSRLAGLFEHAGLQVRETGIIESWNDQHLSPSDMQAEWDLLATDVAHILSPEELERFRQLDADARSRHVRRLYVPTHFAWGQV